MIYIGLSLLHVFLTFVMFRYIPVWKNIHTIIFVTYAVLLFLTLLILTRRTHPPQKT